MKDLFDFFDRLAANNNRPWFVEHKAEYDELRAAWIQGLGRVIAALSDEWPEVRWLDPARATYRIYRDVRFSNDKTPYKTHIGSSIAPPALLKSHIGLYIQAGHIKDDTGIYGGMWCPEAAELRKIRKAIVVNSEEWLDIVNSPAMLRTYGHRWFGEALKTAPKGYDRDHPLIEYLRLKDIGKFTILNRGLFADPAWPDRVADLSRPLIPLCKFLIYTLYEEDT
ncbi:MAG: DUF2461 domain-containing protein [Muribaculaceae bacterium]